MSRYGIPTIRPRGINFGSRLEASWAYFFDFLKWDGTRTYRDFILKFPHKHILVEVKGTTDF